MDYSIAILGKCASGKSTFAQYLKKNWNFTVFELGTYVRVEYSARVKDNSINLLGYANKCYADGDLIRFTKRAALDARQCKGNKVFCGLRTIQDVEYLTSEYPNIILIMIACSDDLRQHRYCKKKSDGVDLITRDNVESVWMEGLLNNIEIDYVVNNDGSLPEYYNNIEDTMREMFTTK